MPRMNSALALALALGAFGGFTCLPADALSGGGPFANRRGGKPGAKVSRAEARGNNRAKNKAARLARKRNR